jgi:hypothetical protein
MAQKIRPATALKKCRTLADQISAALAENCEPFRNISSLVEFEMYLELAASLLRKTEAPAPGGSDRERKKPRRTGAKLSR